MTQSDLDRRFMAQALALAQRGLGYVEPNPPVGCVLVRDGAPVGVGWHQQFGGPHAEIVALEAAGEQAAGATAYVTLEPCAHRGKTGPCVDALIAAGVTRVVVGVTDPNPHVDGRGLATLRAAQIQVDVGVDEPAAAALIAPFAKLQTTGLPWVVAKWAMTLDGKIASRTGSSQWISNGASRDIVHQLRGRMDAIVVGSGTLLADDPLLTARPAGPRVATRVVLDRRGRFPVDCQLLRTIDAGPVLAVLGREADRATAKWLTARGVECFRVEATSDHDALAEVLGEFGRRQWTNVLFEGGGEVLGALLDIHQLDEVHVFMAPKLIGGREAASPMAGEGIAQMPEAICLSDSQVEVVEGDVYVHGRLAK